MQAPKARRGISVCAALGLALLLAQPASAAKLFNWELPELEMPRPVAAGIDVVFIRPLGFLELVVGGIMLVPVVLISAPEGLDGAREAFETHISLPAENVFQRPLGDL